MVEMSRRLLRRLSCQRLQLLPVRAGWRINPLAWIVEPVPGSPYVTRAVEQDRRTGGRPCPHAMVISLLQLKAPEAGAVDQPGLRSPPSSPLSRWSRPRFWSSAFI